jgi:hypothetical protein
MNDAKSGALQAQKVPFDPDLAIVVEAPDSN